MREIISSAWITQAICNIRSFSRIQKRKIYIW